MVLVVDDNVEIAQALTRLFQRVGYRAVSAESAADAMRVIDRTPPELIILDVMMPVMDGIECLHHIRQHPNGKAVPVVMYSASDDRETQRRAYAAGAASYVIKGQLRWDDFLTLVRTHIRDPAPPPDPS
jgi:CheY-like chemotaxis protein